MKPKIQLNSRGGIDNRLVQIEGHIVKAIYKDGTVEFES